MDIAQMTRAELEGAIVEYRIMPLDTPTQVDAALAMTDETMRAIVRAWVEAGDECAGSK